jgi:hypothetical protein
MTGITDDSCYGVAVDALDHAAFVGRYGGGSIDLGGSTFTGGGMLVGSYAP